MLSDKTQFEVHSPAGTDLFRFIAAEHRRNEAIDVSGVVLLESAFENCHLTGIPKHVERCVFYRCDRAFAGYRCVAFECGVTELIGTKIVGCVTHDTRSPTNEDYVLTNTPLPGVGVSFTTSNCFAVSNADLPPSEQPIIVGGGAVIEDENYETVLLRVLVREIHKQEHAESHVCDEQRWAALMESEAWREAKKQIENYYGLSKTTG